MYQCMYLLYCQSFINRSIIRSDCFLEPDIAWVWLSVSVIRMRRKISQRNLRAEKCAESRCCAEEMVTWGQVSSQSEARSGWTTDQSEAGKLQAETVKITAVNTQAMAGHWCPRPRLVCKYCCRFGFYPGTQASGPQEFIGAHSLTTRVKAPLNIDFAI